MSELRKPALDGIRGVAILAVVAFHCLGSVPLNNGFDRALALVAGLGWMGVDLFFVLSGFLITGIIHDHRDSLRFYRSFYARRILRTFPAYYVALLLLFGIPFLLGRERPTQLNPLWLLLHGYNIVAAMRGFPDEWTIHFWSLAVEEQFYLFWPILLMFAKDRKRMMTVCGVAVIASILFRGGWYLSHPRFFMPAFLLTPARLDGFAWGGLLALWVRGTPAKAARNLLLGGAAVSVSAIVFQIAYWGRLSAADWGLAAQSLNLTFIALPFACLVVFVGHTPGAAVTRILASGPLRILGKYSYAIYIYHFWVAKVLSNAGWFLPARYPALEAGLAGLVFASMVLAISSAVAWLSYRVIEKPSLAAKRFFPYRKVR
jgi:peptidoglycan/LPS O-acetylase OafA/YrhL